MTLLEKISEHKGSLLFLKTPIRWYEKSFPISQETKVCVIINVGCVKVPHYFVNSLYHDCDMQKFEENLNNKIKKKAEMNAATFGLSARLITYVVFCSTIFLQSSWFSDISQTACPEMFVGHCFLAFLFSLIPAFIVGSIAQSVLFSEVEFSNRYAWWKTAENAKKRVDFILSRSSREIEKADGLTSSVFKCENYYSKEARRGASIGKPETGMCAVQVLLDGRLCWLWVAEDDIEIIDEAG